MDKTSLTCSRAVFKGEYHGIIEIDNFLALHKAESGRKEYLTEFRYNSIIIPS